MRLKEVMCPNRTFGQGLVLRTGSAFPGLALHWKFHLRVFLEKLATPASMSRIVAKPFITRGSARYCDFIRGFCVEANRNPSVRRVSGICPPASRRVLDLATLSIRFLVDLCQRSVWPLRLGRQSYKLQ